MRSYLVRAVYAVSAAAMLAACGSDEVGAEKLDELQAGMPVDSLFRILGKGPLTGEGADTVRVRNGFRVSRYFTNGQNYMVIYVREQPGNVKEFVEQGKETPIVIDGNGKVLGWGWRFYVEEAIAKLGLPTPLVDTTTTPSPVPQAPAAPLDSGAGRSSKSE